MSEQFTLDRDANLQQNIDPTGRKWAIHTKRGSNLFYARPDPDREDAVIPTLIEGHWTKITLLQERIDLFLQRTWRDSDRQAERNRRTVEAVAEQRHEVPAPAADMTAEEKTAVIQRAVDAENAEIASKSQAKRLKVQKVKDK